MILFYLDQTELNDSYRSFIALIAQMDPKKQPFRILVPSYEGGLAEALKSRGLEFDALAFPQAFGFWSKLSNHASYFRKLFRYFQMYPFEAVHCGGSVSSMLSVALKIRFNVPLIWNFGSILPGGFRLRTYKFLASVFCDHLLASSLFVAHQLGRSLAWRKKLNVVYPGFDPESRSILHSEDQKLVLAMAGLLAPWKGHKTFLRAIELVVREIPECRAIIVGEAQNDLYPEYRGELEGLIQELKLSKAVQIQVKGASAQIYVNAAIEPESFDGFAAQAMAAGVPVIAARMGMLPEMVLHESTGILVRAGDANALAEAILRLANDPNARKQFASNARREYESRFSPEAFFKYCTALYAQFIASEEEQPVEQSMEEDVSDKDLRKAG